MMSEIIKKQLLINAINLPQDILSIIKDYVFNDTNKYMVKIKKKKNITLTQIKSTIYSGKNINNNFDERCWIFWYENDEKCPQFQAYFCTKCGNYINLSSLTYDTILKIMCDCD